MNNFNELGTPENICACLQRLGITNPTEIQQKSIPHSLNGVDIIGSAQTGTGKTVAFLVPVISKLIDNKDSNAIILVPTRELAVQIAKSLQDILTKSINLKAVLLIGGEDIRRQLRDLSNKKPRIIIGTPGRISDHLRRESVDLSKTDMVVLDETDRMLDMGFKIQIEEIFEFLPERRQTLLFSATLPKNIIKITEKYLNSPMKIEAGRVSSPAEKVRQQTVNVQETEKLDVLKKLIHSKSGSSIVFVKTKRAADKLSERLESDGFSVAAIHGDLKHGRRQQVISMFKNKKVEVLVATDIAARGLDIDHIEHVINFDLPQCPEDYIHRIGRTARGDKDGDATSLVSPSDRKKWREIERLLNPDIGPSDYNENARAPSKKPFGKKRNKSSGGFFGKSNKSNSKPDASKKPKDFSKKFKPKFSKKAA
jgi:ATP-dependent RNA helicase DeaD